MTIRKSCTDSRRRNPMILISVPIRQISVGCLNVSSIYTYTYTRAFNYDFSSHNASHNPEQIIRLSYSILPRYPVYLRLYQSEKQGLIKAYSFNQFLLRVAQMSMVPLMFRDWWDDFDRPVSRIMDQHFGRVLNRDDLISRFSDFGFDRPARSMLSGRYLRPWRNVSTRQPSSGSSTIQLDNKDNFQVGDSIELFAKHEPDHFSPSLVAAG